MSASLFLPEESGASPSGSLGDGAVAREIVTALTGLTVNGDFLGRCLTLTEADPALTRAQGFGGTFAVEYPVTIEKIAAARAELRRRFAEAQP